jgi:hypothetical protein
MDWIYGFYVGTGFVFKPLRTKFQQLGLCGRKIHPVDFKRKIIPLYFTRNVESCPFFWELYEFFYF